MKAFNVTLEQTRRGTIRVEARTQVEAERIAKLQVRDVGLVDASDGCCEIHSTTVFLTLEAAR